MGSGSNLRDATWSSLPSLPDESRHWGGDRSEEDRASLSVKYSRNRHLRPNKNRNNPRQVFKNTQASAFPYSSNLHVSHQVMYKVTES